jgi:mannitol-1-phosphate/altronate dehydrogenase
MPRKILLSDLQIAANTCSRLSRDMTLTLEEREQAKRELRKLQSRIANRLRYDALRSIGLKKTPYGWE